MTTETLTAPAVAEPTTPIKPSEALRLGRLVRPRRTKGAMTDWHDGACAVGAMGTAGGFWEALGPLYRVANCPIPHGDHVMGGLLLGVVEHLNDDHDWSDDQIVVWLESLGL